MLYSLYEVIILITKNEQFTISQKLQEAMNKSNLSYGEIANLTNIPKSAIHRYISGETPKIPLDRLEKIAQTLGVSAAWVIGWDKQNENNKSFPTPKTTDEFITFPVLGEIAAGYDSIALEDWDGDVVDIPTSYLKGRTAADFFVLRVKGDSMYPAYHDNDRVLILKQTTLNYSGQVGAILYDGEYATLKKVEYVTGEDWLRLIPINPTHPPKMIQDTDLERCRVIGIPKLLIRDIEN